MARDRPHHPVSPKSLRAARRMRREPTHAEAKLWRLLRSRSLSGWKFRRQVPVGPYVVDFVCFEARLVVEADGGQHCENGIDRARDQWFAENGFRVARYWNNDVLGNPDGVLADLLARLTDPSPLAGEGGRSEAEVG